MKKNSCLIAAITLSATTIALAGCGAENAENASPPTLGTPIYETVPDDEKAGDAGLGAGDEENSEGITAENSSDLSVDETGKSDEIISNEGILDKETQLEVILAGFEKARSEFVEEAGEQNPQFTVADLNHNGRLELIISDCQGSGAFSFTAFYEVSEDGTSLETIPVSGSEHCDTRGDFIASNVLICYKSEDKYYYVLEDYTSSGWDWKGVTYYCYSFNDTVECSDMGGFVLHGMLDAENNCIYNVKLYDSRGRLCSSEEDYLADKMAYFKDYEKMPSCKLTWMSLAEDIALSDKLRIAYAGYTPEYNYSEVDYSYTKIFGEDIEYILD